jgi:RsiW-degrading membrane proteinase PrsW (M82 family)
MVIPMIEAEKYLQQHNKPIEADSSQESPPQPTSIPLRSASPGAKAQENVQYQKWLPVILASGLFGIISVLLSQTGFLVLGPLSTIFVAPISEEILKLAVPIMILEHKTKLIQNRFDLLYLAAGSGLVFAIAENLLYMLSYSLSPGVLAWRWIACTGMHIGASSLGGIGLMRAYDHASRTSDSPRFISELKWLLAAIGIHFTFNLLVTLFG